MTLARGKAERRDFILSQCNKSRGDTRSSSSPNRCVFMVESLSEKTAYFSLYPQCPVDHIRISHLYGRLRSCRKT